MEFLMQLPKRKMRPLQKTKTGNEKLDSLLNKEAQGRSQQQVATPGHQWLEQEGTDTSNATQSQPGQQRLLSQLATATGSAGTKTQAIQVRSSKRWCPTSAELEP